MNPHRSISSSLLSLVSTLVAVPSHAPHEKNIAQTMGTYLNSHGVRFHLHRVAKDRYNLYAEKGPRTKSILLYGHMDTVPVHPGWKTDPYVLTQKGDRAYGLGAWDMKGGVAVMIRQFIETTPQQYGLKLALCVDEENESLGGFALVDHDFFQDVACVVSAEPAFFHGNSGMVTARAGRCLYEAIFTTPSRHAALYHPSHDLVSAFVLFHQRINAVKELKKRHIVFTSDVSTEKTGLSTPSCLVAQIETLLFPPLQHSRVRQDLIQIGKYVRKKFPAIAIGIRPFPRTTPFLESYSFPETDPYLQRMQVVIKTVTGSRAIPYTRPSVADENIFGARGVTTIGIGASGGNAHNSNEWISLSSLHTLYNIVGAFLDQKNKPYGNVAAVQR